jgi:hypothetical protein
MKKQLITVAAYVALQFGLSGINTAQAQVTYTMSGNTWTGFNFNNITAENPSGFTGTLTGVSVNVTLNASVNYTYADDICVYVAGNSLALGGLLQCGGFSNLNATQRYSWANGGTDAPGTTVTGTVNFTTGIVFTGAASDPVIWIGNGYGAAGTSGTWTGTITLNGISLATALPTCTAPTLSATITAECAGFTMGSIDLTATGGSPTPLTYAWSDGYTGEDRIGENVGTYTVTVTTQTGGCSTTASYTIAAAANVTYYADADGDGFGAGTATNLCLQPAGYVLTNTDCNDNNAAVNSAATEVCNSIDDDCDGSTDEGVGSTYYADVDGDTYGNASSSVQGCTASVGYVSNSTDCNDNNAAVNSAATEICNSIDDDCDTQINEGLTFTNYYADADGDGFGAGTATNACAQPVGYVSNSTDCNANNAAVNPAATEVCNGIDDDCNTQIDEGLTFTNYYADVDGDGYGAGTATNACAQPVGYVSNSTDCNDANAAVNPGATEICNSIDDDCDTQINEGLTFTNYYADADGDGFGAGTVTNACAQPAGYVTNSSDCNDTNIAINPTTTWYLNADGDGYYVWTSVSCTSPGANYNTTGGTLGDCNDTNAAVHTGATETCNGIDDDCDGMIDENSSNTY